MTTQRRRTVNVDTTLPALLRAFLSSPAAAVLAPDEEAALGHTILDTRATAWASLASLASELGSRGDELSSAVHSAATLDAPDDELLARAIASARAAIGNKQQHVARSWLVEAATAARSLQKAKDNLCGHNMKLLVQYARERLAAGIAVGFSDLIQEGSIGLMIAATRFDVRRGLRFSTYAAWWMRFSIERAIADKARTIRLPVHIHEGRARIVKALRSLEADGIAEPTDTMIAREVMRRTLTVRAVQAADKASALAGETVAPVLPTEDDIAAGLRAPNAIKAPRVAAIREALTVTTISANMPLRGIDGEHIGDMQSRIEDERAAADKGLLADDAQRAVDLAIASLPPRSADIVRRHRGLGVEEESLTDIGRTHDISRERTRQLGAAALATMRKALRQHGIMSAADAGCAA